MASEKWFQEERTAQVLKDEAVMLYEAGYSLLEIHERLEVPLGTLRTWLRHVSQDRPARRVASHGARRLRERLREVFPHYRLEEEYHLGERLRLDFYLPELGLAFEVDGSQHRRFHSFFHQDEAAWQEARNRDRRKEELCREAGIHLVRLPADVLPDHHTLLTIAEAAGQADAPGVSPWHHWRRLQREELRRQNAARRQELRQALRAQRRQRQKQESQTETTKPDKEKTRGR